VKVPYGLRLNPEGNFRGSNSHIDYDGRPRQITLSDKRLPWRVKQQERVPFRPQGRKSCRGRPTSVLLAVIHPITFSPDSYPEPARSDNRHTWTDARASEVNATHVGESPRNERLGRGRRLRPGVQA